MTFYKNHLSHKMLIFQNLLLINPLYQNHLYECEYYCFEYYSEYLFDSEYL